jgi:CheY-like chemotaxis protein
LTLSLISDDRGRPIGIASIAKDISRQKQAEHETQLAVRRRDEFLAMLSHELRNPVSAARTACHAISEGKAGPEALKRSCQIISRQIGHMARLLDDLLDVSRVVQGKIALRRELHDLGRTTMDAIEALQPRIQERGQRLTVELPRTPVMVMGDEARLRQIQENLLSNASKFTSQGGQIGISLVRDGDEAVIRVKDNGRGIPQDLLGSVFELFAQGDRPLHRADGGMGIGLTMVRHLVHLHGGRVTAHSEGLERGSLFEVRLPLGTDTPAHEPAARPTPAADAPRRAAAQRVLLIEDNEDARESLKTLLELDGLQVWEAADGERGLAVLLDQKPDIAFVDIGLPGLDGYEVAKRARAVLGSAVRLVALTGYGTQSDRLRVREAGFDAHLVKPVSVNTLRRMLSGGEE